MKKQIIFDAYGTLIDLDSVVNNVYSNFGQKASQLNHLWRTKQLEYTWLTSLEGSYIDFWDITKLSLDYAFNSLEIENDQIKKELLDSYKTAPLFPEFKGALSN